MGDTAISVIACVIKRGGQYLLAQRPPHKRHGGLWEFPGGKVEPGETMLEAARRELAEELGVSVRSIEPACFSIRDPLSAFIIEFGMAQIDGAPHALEHSALAWVDRANLERFHLAYADRAFVQYLNSTRAISE